MSKTSLTISAAIPTYQRGSFLLETVRQLLIQKVRADEILIVDQTPTHPPEVEAGLTWLEKTGQIRWFRQHTPNAQIARNRCLLESKCDVVLFLDDDVILPPNFIDAHRSNYHDAKVAAVAGRVISTNTPAHADELAVKTPRRPRFDFKFLRLDGVQRVEGVANLIGANYSVRRKCLLDIGGCDESYISAVLDDVDTAIRLWKAQHMIVYDPDAWLKHLMAPTGGHGLRPHTMPMWKRFFATHYFYQRHVYPHPYFWLDIPFRAFRRSVFTRHALSRPWRLPWAISCYWFACFQAAYSSPRLLEDSLCVPPRAH